MRVTTAVALLLLFAGVARVEEVKLKATADIGVSGVVYGGADERVKSWGLSGRFKLKSIQEMGVIRFDASPAKGREVFSAKLFLHRAGKDMLRYVRVSTVNSDWEEGKTKRDYGPPSGACFNYADYDAKREWAWPGSQLCDVILGAGHSLHHWAEREKLPDGWISVDLPPELIYALAVGDSDGLAVQEGGSLAYLNNFIHSVQSGRFAPYIEVTLGRPLEAVPGKPVVKAEPGAEVARVGTGAVKLTVNEAGGVFCWRVKLNGEPVPRWQVAHPAPNGPTTFFIEYLEPAQECEIEVAAVSRGGAVSEPASLKVTASSALPVAPVLGDLRPPRGRAGTPAADAAFTAWPCPALVKVDPLESVAMNGDMLGKDGTAPNAVWDGRRISLYGCRGEYVSFQLVVERVGESALKRVKVTPSELRGPRRSTIGGAEIEVYRNWYAQNGDKKWQPAYCVPLKHGEGFDVPDPKRDLESQRNQTVYVDVYIPKDARPGWYAGSVSIEAGGGAKAQFPVSLEVYDFLMPDRLAFWPQLNCYRLPGGAGDKSHDIYRLAHQHRNVFFQRNFRPKVEGKGEDIKVVWDQYDKAVGPLLSGEAFKGNRRSGVPIEALGLPFIDSWPTPLSKETYKYDGDWTRSSEGKDRAKYKGLTKIINEHFVKAPYIGDGLTQEYKDAFASVQKQFVEHFREEGWDGTECQCLFMGKSTHRIRYNVNMWWTTDEPYHWDDWLALQFFGRLWTQGRSPGDAKQWVFRADISRPQWQARTLDGAVDVIHFGTGAFSSPAMYRRAELLARQTPFHIRVYGGANRDNRSNIESVVWFLNAWLNGANGALPWQTMGNDKSLDVNDASVGGNAMIAPGNRFGVPAVADMRLKAFRDGEQLVEYLVMFSSLYGLTREQVKAILYRSISIEADVAAGASADNADALRFSALKAWQVVELRRRLAALILRKTPRRR